MRFSEIRHSMNQGSVTYTLSARDNRDRVACRRNELRPCRQVVHVGTNPVFQLPKELGYEEALKRVPGSVSLVEAVNETSRYCAYVLPANHALESWGDFKVRTGVYSFQQPVIAPLYDSRQKEAVLLSWALGKDSYQRDAVS